LLVLLVAGLVTLWSANVLTMIISWAIYDLIQAIGHIVARGSERTAIRGLILGSLATLLLWGGALLSDGRADSELWSLMTLGNAQLTLWTMSGILRLWMYPFHLSAPDDLDGALPLATPLFLGPVVGWGLWLRLTTANGGFIPGDTWAPTLAAVTLALGGLLAWSCGSSRRILPWIGMGAAGTVLLAAGLAGESAAAVIVAGGVTWTLGVAALSLGRNLQRGTLWWSIPSLIGASALLGAPLTLGFVTEATLIGGLTRGDHVGWGSAVLWGTVFGNLFLVPSLVRWLLSSPGQPVEESTHSSTDQPATLLSRLGRLGLILAPVNFSEISRAIGLGLSALLLVVTGLYPPLLIGDVLAFSASANAARSLGSLFALLGLTGWLLWVIPLVCGGVLAWQEKALRPRIEPLLTAIHDVLRLEWLYDVVIGALNRGLRIIQVADEVIGGTGALLWSWLLFLLLLLMWGRL
jgi:formate hydrogenlyase subunit 3/multisubunit Na+/H+ antiporter MnhD subunit